MTRAFRPNLIERYLSGLMAKKARHSDKFEEETPFERRTKAITKGDPREFMG